MKTTAFLIRALICLALSLIPATEVDNRILSARLSWRGAQGSPPQVTMISVGSREFNTPSLFQGVENQVAKLGPARILVVPSANPDARPIASDHFLLDSDGVVRRARFDLGLPVPRWGRDVHFINFAGPPGAIPTCRLRDCPNLAGRIALLSEEDDSPPLFRTPLGQMSRAEIVANDAFTVLGPHPIRVAGFPERAVVIAAMILTGAFFILYYPVMVGAIAVSGVGAAVVIVFFQLLFEFFGLYVPSFNIGLSLLVTYLVFTGYRMAVQENLQWRSLKQAQYLRELDQMKTNFLSLVSHDLKTPIAKIQAVAERMRRELGLPPEARSDWRELVDSIENSSNELKHYILSILSLSKIESQKVILNKRSNDVNSLIAEALKRLKPLAQQRGIEIEESLEPLFSVECDGDLVRQVISNLIDNAIKYSPPGSRVIVRSREEEGFLRVAVEDFGPGIPKDQLPLMFRKFSRFLRPMKEQVKGSGLGLYLSKYFIELHGGGIQLKSEEGKGTTFTFTLPLTGGEGEAILG